MDSLEMLATNTEVPYHRSSTNSCENELEIIGQEQPSIHTNPYVNAGFEECEKNGGGSKSDPFLAKGCTKTWHGGTDDGLVYANLSEIARRKELEAIDRRPYPPFPDATAQPLRIIANGWREYRTQGGRSYYFHPENGICQWKPPRNTIIGRALLQQFESNSSPNEAVHENCAASTSTGSTEFFAEIPLHRDMMMRKSENGRQGSSNNFDIHKSAVAECLENINTAKKEIMSHSLDGGMNHHQAESGKDDPATALYDTPANVSTPPHQHQQRGAPIKHGLLDKCRLTENGVKVKRKDWCSAYAYLYIGHLLFYKDQKSAEKTGKHYPAPTDVCDLRNAIISYIENDKQRDKRRKYIISLILISNTEYNLSCGGGDDHEIQDWYNALRQAITTMSTSKISTITNPPIVIEYNGSLQRSIRHKRGGGGGDKDTFGTFSSKSTLHNSIKSRLKTSSTSKTISSEDHFSVCTENSAIESSPPAKATIIERLLRFFRTRPTMESLREKGIYKPEPVFGSTLGEICTREKSLVPKFITEVTALIEQKGIDSDGLYRVNGNLSSVQKIRCQIDQDFYDAMRNEEDIHVLSGALKLFLRELGEPIFPVSMHKDFMSAMRESGNKRFRSIDELLLRMPPVNKETLRVLITHLNRVATNSGKNRMQVHNLAIIFGPSLFCSEERTGHLRKPSQDKGGKGGGGGSKRKSLDKRGPAEDVQQQQQQPTGPTQNLAYRMIVYGQILEFVLSESERLTIFRGPT